MLTITNPADAEILAVKGEEEFRLPVKPNKFNKFQLYLTGKAGKGVGITGVGPFSMRAYYSLIDYSGLVGIALEKEYKVFIRKDAPLLKEGNWYLEFRKEIE